MLSVFYDNDYNNTNDPIFNVARGIDKTLGFVVMNEEYNNELKKHHRVERNNSSFAEYHKSRQKHARNFSPDINPPVLKRSQSNYYQEYDSLHTITPFEYKKPDFYFDIKHKQRQENFKQREKKILEELEKEEDDIEKTCFHSNWVFCF